jgi:hypothetical protein
LGYVKWIFLALIVILIGGFLHYTLPQNDIVRVVNTEVRRISPGANALFWSSSDTDDAGGTRDVFFIETIQPNGKPIVYRNEDTGLWPPFFKYNSANVQALAKDLESNEGDPRWVAVRHYGWRAEFFSIFPNATSVRPVTSPDERIIPWFNIVFFVVLAVLVLWLARVWRRFRAARVDPLLDDLDEAVDETRARGRGLWRRITGR